MKNKKTIIALVAAVVAVALLAGIYLVARPQGAEGEKTFTLTVVHSEGAKDFTITTQEEFLAHALIHEGIITDCTQEEIFLRHTMLDNAARKVFLCDSSKLGKQAPYVQCDLRRIDTLIGETDCFRSLQPRYPHLQIF